MDESFPALRIHFYLRKDGYLNLAVAVISFSARYSAACRYTPYSPSLSNSPASLFPYLYGVLRTIDNYIDFSAVRPGKLLVSLSEFIHSLFLSLSSASEKEKAHQIILGTSGRFPTLFLAISPYYYGTMAYNCLNGP